MTSWAVGWLASFVSLVLIVWLALRDPKRIRNHPALRGMPAHSDAKRKWLGWGSMLPGLGLVFYGELVALCIWMGAVMTIGWIVVVALAPRAQQAPSE